ncbi:MAG TPA: helix-turn-helix transcriptional regulator [Bryobacteraceae bacterium]|nr:helix-turn-helix transcriptional regulator [Bryobacteraceae bacterium]
MEAKTKGAVTAPTGTTPLNLAIHRQNGGLSLEDVAELTKISMFFLRAIEAGEYGKLPGGIYTTSYLRQYAAAIGFDVATLLAEVAPAPEVETEVPAAPCRGILDRWFRLPALQRP